MRLGEPHVPDTGDEPLVDESLAHELRLVAAADPGDDVGNSGRGREEIGPESANATVAQGEHRAVPLRRLSLTAAQDEPW